MFEAYESQNLLLIYGFSFSISIVVIYVMFCFMQKDAKIITKILSFIVALIFAITGVSMFIFDISQDRKHVGDNPVNMQSQYKNIESGTYNDKFTDSIEKAINVQNVELKSNYTSRYRDSESQRIDNIEKIYSSLSRGERVEFTAVDEKEIKEGYIYFTKDNMVIITTDDQKLEQENVVKIPAR